MRIGEYSDFTVVRETDLGYMLREEGESDPEKDLFLHHNECANATLAAGQALKAFVYVDKKGRVAATLRTPSMTQSHGGFGTVSLVSSALGAFVFYGPSKDALLSKDDLPKDTATWPRVGAKIPGVLRPHGGKLLVKMMNKPEMLSLEGEGKLAVGNKVTAYVYRMTPDGINLATADFHIIFVHVSQILTPPTLGEEETVRITKVNDVDYNGTLKPTPQEEDAAREALATENEKKILDYLLAHDSLMTITDASSPLVIEKVFAMSKVQFKEALGHLYKEKKIFIAPDRVILL